MIKNLNYILILATIVVLTAIGLVFIYGSVFSWMQSVAQADWRQTTLYQGYVDNMNLGVLPLSILLVVLLGLCVPKRIFQGAALLTAMAVLLAVAAVTAAVFGFQISAYVILLAAAAVQLVVLIMTLVGSKRLSYEVNGFYVQTGSALLHLGLILFVLDFALLNTSTFHLAVYWAATVLIGLGMVLCFYAPEFSRAVRRRA